MNRPRGTATASQSRIGPRIVASTRPRWRPHRTVTAASKLGFQVGRLPSERARSVAFRAAPGTLAASVAVRNQRSGAAWSDLDSGPKFSSCASSSYVANRVGGTLSSRATHRGSSSSGSRAVRGPNSSSRASRAGSSCAGGTLSSISYWRVAFSCAITIVLDQAFVGQSLSARVHRRRGLGRPRVRALRFSCVTLGARTSPGHKCGFAFLLLRAVRPVLKRARSRALPQTPYACTRGELRRTGRGERRAPADDRALPRTTALSRGRPRSPADDSAPRPTARAAGDCCARYKAWRKTRGPKER